MGWIGADLLAGSCDTRRVRCSSCAAEVAASATSCPYCHAVLRAVSGEDLDVTIQAFEARLRAVKSHDGAVAAFLLTSVAALIGLGLGLGRLGIGGATRIGLLIAVGFALFVCWGAFISSVEKKAHDVAWREGIEADLDAWLRERGTTRADFDARAVRVLDPGAGLRRFLFRRGV
jgi:hypothetical protein